jgi:hypothetical protein
MKNIILLLSILMSLVHGIYGQNSQNSRNSHGILFMTGGRYDNLRMCAASPAGVKGGPIADIMLITKHKLNENHSLTFNLPFMRPILFGLAFKMLQFEPELTLECNKLINEKIDFVSGPGIGISFHYGPDYKSNLSDPSESFFAIGPFISWQTGIAFKKESGVKSIAGFKAFYVPLSAEDRSLGTVLGGALLYTFYF